MARDSKRGRFGAGSQHGEASADATEDTIALDIASVRRDDELIDAIASDGPVATDSAEEYELATLLAGWRAELTGPPLPDAPDLDAVVAAVNQEIGARTARARAGGRLRLVRPIVGAAAAIAVVVGAMTAFSYNAEPGDPLWKVKEVVFSDQADSTVANIDTTSDLQEAEELIAAGRPEEAQVLLDRAATRATDVDDAGQREDLLTTLQRLADDVKRQLPTIPQVPAPPIAPTTSGAPQSTNSPTLPTSSAADTVDPGTDTGAPSEPSVNPPTIDTSILLSPPESTDLPTTVEPSQPSDTTAPQQPSPEPTTDQPTQEPTTASQQSSQSDSTAATPAS